MGNDGSDGDVQMMVVAAALIVTCGQCRAHVKYLYITTQHLFTNCSVADSYDFPLFQVCAIFKLNTVEIFTTFFSKENRTYLFHT